ncbi:VOC family protein [Streptomyces olivochromogenes]|uniref:VOC family protein n=1 Tax=Streptomyces olivochromogenes TaxID=1963 RepID=UPI001F3139B2|nr:VOC family protein [Streptomyces olivochromogenes]MCF3133682.1 VOC family protein [Streptomyces olivochromogenes]
MTVHSFHHTGVVTHDLDELARRYTALGFTVSPRSRHLLSAAPGEAPVPGCTANQCVVFADSYIELLGIVDGTAPDPWRAKELGIGFRLVNFATDDAEATATALSAAGVPAHGVLDLARDVETEDGPRTVKARAVHLDPRSTVEGFVGIAQHLTRNLIHQPRWQDHPNGAHALATVRIAAAEADFDAIVQRYAQLLEAAPERHGTLAVLPVGGARLEIAGGAAVSRFEAMTVAVADLAHARRTVEDGGIATETTEAGFAADGLFFTERS